MNNLKRIAKLLPLLCAIAVLNGCVLAATSGVDRDPYENINRKVYNFNDALDKYAMEPLAKGYQKITPGFFRTGVTNFFDNAGYISVIVNDLLQGKFHQAWDDTGRFIINSTVGIGGLFDPAAAHTGLPKRDEDFGQTFAAWGWGQGPYLVIPGIGPQTLRNLPDFFIGLFLNPLTTLSTTYTLPLGVLAGVNARSDLLEASKFRDQAALDPYTFTREAYLQHRRFLIYDGEPPSQGLDEFIEDDGGIVPEENMLIIE